MLQNEIHPSPRRYISNDSPISARQRSFSSVSNDVSQNERRRGSSGSGIGSLFSTFRLLRQPSNSSFQPESVPRVLPDITLVKSHSSGISVDYNGMLPLTVTFKKEESSDSSASSLSSLESLNKIKGKQRDIIHRINSMTNPFPAELHLNIAKDSLPKIVHDNPRQDRIFSIRLTPFLDPNSSSNTKCHGMFFHAMTRTAGPNSQLVICRSSNSVESSFSVIPEKHRPITFKSNVVSRIHGFFKVDTNGNWFIQDIKSAGGTFLNHQRIAKSYTTSQDHLLSDGDIIQLGMDATNGSRSSDDLYRCVRIRVDLNDSWKNKSKEFNRLAKERLQGLTHVKQEKCAICLYNCKPYQPIFISPCGHYWHFNCIKQVLLMNYPQYTCPNCRSSFDLEGILNDSDEEEEEAEDEGDVNSCSGNMDTYSEIDLGVAQIA